ncbi:MAG: hypothetical protein IMZ53_05610 [Thermoplasmata archaeon]|nr:hypothetical protein [Thermoplasmata archaeon]
MGHALADFTSSADVTVTYSIIVTPPTVTNGIGATLVAATTARLNGEVTNTGNENPTVDVFYGLTDGGTNPVAWDDTYSLGIVALGTCFIDVSGLLPTNLYYYRMRATNGGGVDWADSTANFTTPAIFDAPAGLTLTDLGAITIGANWTKGAGTTYTMLRVSRGDYPILPTEGELFYYGDAETANSTGYSLDTNGYYVSAWGYLADNVTYTGTYITATIGGGAMTAIATALTAIATTLTSTVASLISLLIVVLITALAFWANRPGLKPKQRSPFLLLIACPVDLIYGLAIAAGSVVKSASWVEGIMVAVIGTFCLIKVVLDQISTHRIKD